MEAPSTPKPVSPSALQHRQQEHQRQAKFLKLAVPIALLLHGITIGGGAFLMGRGGREVAIDEVEIIAGETPTASERSKDQAGGGGDPKLSLFQSQTPEGKKDGNNIAALGNPFASPDVKTPEAPSIEPPQVMPIEASTEPMADDTVDPDEKPIEDSKKKPEAKSISSNSTDNKNKPATPGSLEGEKGGKDQKGEPTNKSKDPNLPPGPGPNAIPSKPANPPKPINPPKPSDRPSPSPAPSASPKPTTPSPATPKPDIAIVTPTRPTPKKGPRCVENCSLDDYLGAEGKADIRLKIDRDGNVIEATLGSSSGNTEVDRQALEHARSRKYTPSDEGANSSFSVTSERPNSEFARQQEERRRQEKADRDRTISAPEPREPDRISAPAAPEPVVEPIVKPVPEPIPEPVSKPIPEPSAPAVPEPVVEPVAPAPEPVAPPVAEPIAEPAPALPEPTVPEPAVAEPIAPAAAPVVP